MFVVFMLTIIRLKESNNVFHLGIILYVFGLVVASATDWRTDYPLWALIYYMWRFDLLYRSDLVDPARAVRRRLTPSESEGPDS